MQKNKISILSTRPFSTALAEEARAEGIEIDIRAFIRTEPVQSVQVQQEIEQAFLQRTAVVFTSMNAVDAVAAWLEEQEPDWTIYCLGKTTRELVIKYFGEHHIAATANSAAELAEQIIDETDTDELIFFCGDQRRDELPDLLRANGVEVTEIIVYQTITVPHKIEKTYHGILFFSPSAVESFFVYNKVPAGTVFFAIGATTADAIKKHSTNKIIISNEPGKEKLVRRMMDYFNPVV